MFRRVFPILLLTLTICSQPALSQEPGARDTAQLNSKIRILGAGSTTIYPLLSAWIKEYTRLHSDVRIEYQSIGTGGGTRALMSKSIDLAAIDRPMTDEQLANTSGQVLHFPVTLHDVVPIYNVPQVRQLSFGGTTLANIFLGKIKRWNDPAIAHDNPGVDLPDMEIKVIHQFPRPSVPAEPIIADYLSRVSPQFKVTLADSSGKWPLPQVSRDENIAGLVRDTPGAIGYLESAFARQNRISYAAVENAAGEFVTASPESLAAAASTAVGLIRTTAPDFRVSVVNGPGNKAYPIVSFIWIALYEDSPDKKKNKVTTDFLKWVLTDGQELARRLGYAPLPDDLLELELQRLEPAASSMTRSPDHAITRSSTPLPSSF